MDKISTETLESIKADNQIGSMVLLESAASGSDIPDSHLNKIKNWMRTAQPKESIHTFPVLMIDTAPTRNKVIYTAESQKTAIKKWPGTTFLFNSMGSSSGGLFGGQADHELQAASQFGRIYDARLVKTPRGETGTLGWFYSVEGIDDATDGFIRKLEAGILREVSIHVSVPEGVICSICKDSFDNCQEKTGEAHYPGEKYKVGKKTETCYMSTGTGPLIPLELSAVACPGSINAHVMQDDEVTDYSVVSLREALGGSREVIQSIKEQRMDPIDKSAEEELETELETEETEPIVETEEKKPKPKKGDDGKDGDGDNDGPGDGDANSKQSALFAGADCPACGRSEAAPVVENPDLEVVRESVRAEFREQINAVIAKADAAILEAQEENENNAPLLAERETILGDIVNDTVTLAIAAGRKKSHESVAYREQLSGLSYSALREVQETLKLVAASKTSSKERLETSMAAQAKEMLGVTVVTTSSGNKQSITGQRPRLAAK